MWEMDYPHSDSTWPTAPEQLWKTLGGLPADATAMQTLLKAASKGAAD